VESLEFRSFARCLSKRDSLMPNNCWSTTGLFNWV